MAFKGHFLKWKKREFFLMLVFYYKKVESLTLFVYTEKQASQIRLILVK